MAYQALYRKYRPQTFSDVVGQEHITETLKNELSAGRTVHAYLFTGSRGTGKTSCAKILAKAVNCLNPAVGDPCLECESCLSIAGGENTDIVEIDAASNNSVDSIRELRERVAFAPSASKYRVYIIDEVHMLSDSAFNALLKTLEEPPPHVIFILATTEVRRLPATILSRCQRFDFRRIDPELICERIRYIAQQEGFSVTPEAASLIAAAADGGLRDALSILDLCACGGGEIDEHTVERVCGMAGSDYLTEMADFIKERNTEGALKLIDRLYAGSVDMQRLVSELASHYRDLMIIKTVKGGSRPIVCSAARLAGLEKQAADYDIEDIMRCLSAFQAASAAQGGSMRFETEMTVIRLCDPRLTKDYASLERRVSALERASAGFSGENAPKPSAANPQQKNELNTDLENSENGIKPQAAEVPPETSEPDAEEEPAAPAAKPDGGNVTPVENWSEVLSVLKSASPLMAGVLKDSKAYIKGQYLLIDAPNSQFRSLINSGGPYKESIRAAARTVLGGIYKLGPYTAVRKAEEQDPLATLADKLKNFEIN